VARSDDSENVVRDRLKLYWRETQPMIAHYHARPTYRVVDGMQEPESVLDALVAAVASALGKRPDELPRGNMLRPGPAA
jgi:adenylate kinase